MKHTPSRSTTLQLLQIFFTKKASIVARPILITFMAAFFAVLASSTSAKIVTIRFGGDIPCVGITIGQNGEDSPCINEKDEDEVFFGVEDDWYFIGELTYTDWEVQTSSDYTEYFMHNIVAALGPNSRVAQLRFDSIQYDAEYDRYYGPRGTLVSGDWGYDLGNKYDSVKIADNSFDLTSAPAPVDAFIASAYHDGEFLVEYPDSDPIVEMPKMEIYLLEYGLNADPYIFHDEELKYSDDLEAYFKDFDINYFGIQYMGVNESFIDIRAPIDWVVVSEPSSLGVLLIVLVGLLKARRKILQ